MGSSAASSNQHPTVLSKVTEGTTETSHRSRNSGKSKSSLSSRSRNSGGSSANGYGSNNDPPDEIESHYHNNHRQHHRDEEEHETNDVYPSASGSDDHQNNDDEELQTLASMDTSTFRRLREKRRKQRGNNNDTDSRGSGSSSVRSSKGHHREDPRGGKHQKNRNTRMRYRGSRNSFDEDYDHDERSAMTDGLSRFSRGSHRSNQYQYNMNRGPTSNQYQMGIIFALGLVLVLKAGIVEVKLENTQLRGIIGGGGGGEGDNYSPLNHLSGGSYYQKPTVVNARALEVDEENNDVIDEDSPSETFFKDAVEKLEYGEQDVGASVGENDETEGYNDVGDLSDQQSGQDVVSNSSHLEGEQQLQQPEAIESETPQQSGESSQPLFVQSQQQPGGQPFQEQSQSQFYASSPEQFPQGVNQPGAEYIQQSQQQNLFVQQQPQPQQQSLFVQQQQQQPQPDQQQLYSQQYFNQQQAAQYGQQQNQFGQQLNQQNYQQYQQGQPPYYNQQLQSPQQNLSQQQFDPQAQQVFAAQPSGDDFTQPGQSPASENSDVDTSNLSNSAPAGNLGAVDANSVSGPNSLTDYPPPIPQPQPVDNQVGVESARSLAELNPPPSQTVDSQVAAESGQTLAEQNHQAPPQPVDNQVGVAIDQNPAVESPPSILQPPPVNNQSSVNNVPAEESPQVQAPVEQNLLSSDILNNRIVPFDLGSEPRFRGQTQADTQGEVIEDVQHAPVQVQPDAYGTLKEVQPPVQGQPISREPNRDPNDINFNFKAAVIDDGVSSTNPRLWGSKTLTTPNLRTHLNKNDAKFAAAQDSAIDQIQITV